MSSKESENKSKTLSNPKKGRLIAVSAPSGAGKTTLVTRLLKEFPILKKSISYTTRRPRPGEVEGQSYHFVDKETFLKMIDDKSFFEWEKVHGGYYGTPLQPLLDRIDQGIDTIFDIDTRGALSLKKAFPESTIIFLMPPSMDILENRLRSRGTDTEPVILRRLEDAREQIAEKDKFDYMVINDNLDQAYAELKAIIQK